MLRHLGCRADWASIVAFCGGERQVTEVNPQWIRERIRDNLGELARILHSNAEHGLLFARIPSRIIPFAAYPEWTVPWWDDFAGELARIGQFARRSGIRLEMHPGVHSMLNSPSPETVALSILELGWQIRFLDTLQMDATNKLVLRIGCTFGDRAAALDRFVTVINGLPDEWKIRLAIENNDAHYRLADVLPVARRTGLPVVFACLECCPQGSTHQSELAGLVAQGFETWSSKDGVPIVHFGPSSDDRSRKGHAWEWIEPADIEALIALTPADTPFDCLLDTLQGDNAVFDLRERLANRERAALPSWTDLSRGF